MSRSMDKGWWTVIIAIIIIAVVSFFLYQGCNRPKSTKLIGAAPDSVARELAPNTPDLLKTDETDTFTITTMGDVDATWDKGRNGYFTRFNVDTIDGVVWPDYEKASASYKLVAAKLRQQGKPLPPVPKKPHGPFRVYAGNMTIGRVLMTPVGGNAYEAFIPPIGDQRINLPVVGLDENGQEVTGWGYINEGPLTVSGGNNGYCIKFGLDGHIGLSTVERDKALGKKPLAVKK